MNKNYIKTTCCTVLRWALLLALACVCFVTCQNPIMEKWWDEPCETKFSSAAVDSIHHTVKFEANGGLPAPGDQLIAHEGKIAKLQAMNKDHYGFGGWYTEADFKNEWNFAADIVKEDFTLYARWEPIFFVVKFEAYGGSPPPASQGIFTGGCLVEPPAMSRAGYGFGGWYKDAAFTEPWDFAADTDAVDKNFTLYANWKEDYHTVKFEAYGGSPSPIDQRIALGGKIVEPLPMNRTGGYGFDGWYKESTFTNKWDLASDTVNDNLTLYAKWVDVYHIVIFVANAGDSKLDPKPQQIVSGGKIVEPEVMSREGYGFGGWYTEPGLINEWDFTMDTVDANLTLYAEWSWSPVFYAVEFEANGGTPVPPDQNLIHGSRIVRPPAMSNAGKGFGGWFTDSAFINEWNFYTDTVEEDLKLYAKWDIPFYTVTFNANGGTLGPDDQQIFTGGKVVEPLAMTLTGHGFSGWYKEPALENEWNFATDTVTSNLNLYAKWEVNKYTVTFKADNGSPDETQVIAYGSRLVSPSTVTKPDKSFGGWYTDAGFINEWNFYTDIVDRNLTLYARWSSITYIVEFDSNSGEPKPEDQYIIINSKAVSPPAMTLTGHGFGGWYKDTACTQPWDFAEDTVTKNITLYAKWGVTRFNVTFNANGGTPAPAAQVIATGGRIVEPLPMSRTGYGFGGWYKDEGCTQLWDFAADTVNEDTGLYAEWKPNHNTVTFNANGGSPAPLPQNVVTGNKVTRPAPMARTGYSFGGWYENVNFTGDAWDFAEEISVSLILAARWEKDPTIYNVVFDADPGEPAKDSLANPWPAPQSIVEGGKVIEPSPIRKAISRGSDIWYGFGGWYKDAAYTELWDFNTKLNSDLTLYAKWVEINCLVTFEAYGGDPAPRDQNLAYGARVVEPLAMNRTGFGFGGWYKDTAFTEPWDFTVDVVRDNENLTLYAHWVTNYYTVIFEANGGFPAPVNQFAAHGSALTAPPAMRKPNEGFVGWYRNADFSDSGWNFNINTVNSDTILYAKWGDASYIINFELKLPPGTYVEITSGHGNPVPASQYVTSGGRVSEPPPANIAGWSFVGWYYSNTPTVVNKGNAGSYLHTLEEWDFDKVLTDADINNIILVDIDTPTLTLYARWVPFVPGMVWAQKGSYVMGNDRISGSSPARQIKLTGFYMGIYTITQENYMAVTTFSNPSSFQAGVITRPVDRVSWYDVVEYCNIRTRKENEKNPGLNLTPVYSLNGITDPDFWDGKPKSSPSNWDFIVMNPDANGYRLPTEAEWEYAAKGGNGSPGDFTYSGSNNADDVGWFNTNSGGMTHPVGTKAPNGLGIYDMNGNVSEWCWDWFAPYSSLPASCADPAGPLAGTERVRRGGSWNNNNTNVRTVVRNSFYPDNATYVMGFRVVRGSAEIY